MFVVSHIISTHPDTEHVPDKLITSTSTSFLSEVDADVEKFCREPEYVLSVQKLTGEKKRAKCKREKKNETILQ